VLHLLGKRVSFAALVSGIAGPIGNIRRTKEVVKLRLMAGLKATRRAAATVERWNMVELRIERMVILVRLRFMILKAFG
jgi:hypothetical protein